ncbi:MAG: hypothetical protein IT186_09095 [Acidobacteria bacterium]|nr:hypothetical protein [Acidobacteriota bacterium]
MLTLAPPPPPPAEDPAPSIGPLFGAVATLRNSLTLAAVALEHLAEAFPGDSPDRALATGAATACRAALAETGRAQLEKQAFNGNPPKRRRMV